MRRRIKGLAEQNRKRFGADIVILPAGKLREARWTDIKEDFDKMVAVIENEFG